MSARVAAQASPQLGQRVNVPLDVAGVRQRQREKPIAPRTAKRSAAEERAAGIEHGPATLTKHGPPLTGSLGPALLAQAPLLATEDELRHLVTAVVASDADLFGPAGRHALWPFLLALGALLVPPLATGVALQVCVARGCAVLQRSTLAELPRMFCDLRIPCAPVDHAVLPRFGWDRAHSGCVFTGPFSTVSLRVSR